MLVLTALIFRAVSIEFRSKLHMPAWRKAWDVAFSVASLLATLLFGVAIGNGMIGIPLDSRGVYTGSKYFGLIAGTLYWHFVDVIWVLLFFLFYLW